MNELQVVPLGIWIFLAAVLLLQGTWLFKDAQDRGKGKMAWFWGIWGLTGFPSPLVCYLLFVVLKDRRRSRQRAEL